MSSRHVALVLLLAATPGAAAAQAVAPATSCTPIVAAATGASDSPLDRPVTLHAPSLSLRDALARITAASGVRIAYSGDVLPLDRRVCIDADGTPLGALLEHLLDGIAVVPVVVGATHVVLAGDTRVRAGRTSEDPVADTQQDTVVVALEPLHAHTAPLLHAASRRPAG
jgi:hypothetical protein